MDRPFKFEMIDSADRALFAEPRATAVNDETETEEPTEPRKAELTLSRDEYESLGAPEVLIVTIRDAAAPTG